MKNKLIFHAVVAVLFLASCKKSENNPANIPKCKITEIITTGQDVTGSDPYSYTLSYKFDYNDKNLMSGNSVQQNGKTKNNKTTTYGATTNYQYDADGFLIKQVYQSSSKDLDNLNSSYSFTFTYTYKNGKLEKSVFNNSSTDNKGKTTTETRTENYEYNADGKLSKYSNMSIRDGSSTNTFYLYEYANGILSKLSYNNGISGTVTPLIEINSQGLLTKEVNGTQEYRYQYDTDGNLLRSETWRSGIKMYINIYEYDTQQNINLSIPKFKGHPDVSFYLGKDYLATHNITKDSRGRIIGGVEKIDYTYAYTYQYNSQNLPASSEVLLTGSDGKVMQQSTVNYTYKDCQ